MRSYSSISLQSLQRKVGEWFNECFKGYIKLQSDPRVRMQRLLEEVHELAQANDIPKEDVIRSADYVYDRPKGEIKDEVGGTGVAFLVYCAVSGISAVECILTELKKNWGRIEKIRSRQSSKPIPSGMDPADFVIPVSKE